MSHTHSLFLLIFEGDTSQNFFEIKSFTHSNKEGRGLGNVVDSPGWCSLSFSMETTTHPVCSFPENFQF